MFGLQCQAYFFRKENNELYSVSKSVPSGKIQVQVEEQIYMSEINLNLI